MCLLYLFGKAIFIKTKADIDTCFVFIHNLPVVLLSAFVLFVDRLISRYYYNKTPYIYLIKKYKFYEGGCIIMMEPPHLKVDLKLCYLRYIHFGTHL